MGFRSTCFFVMLAAAILLSGCSRESSVRENVTLRNNHSVVFVSTHPFKNPEAFADSVTNLSNPDSVLVPDTITVTINDTIYMMGFLKHYSERIGRYYWILDSLSKDSSGKFSKKEISKISKNATPIAWVYPQAGVYSPRFVAIDGNNATDTAGADQFIRVINTPPFLSVPKDTLWTKHKTPITFPITALDSFGIIKDVKVDLDASKKKASPKTWKYQQIENTDSLLLTIPYDSNYVDSLGNQMIYVSVTDDDDNETLDSVHIHFNQLPKLELQSPPDGSRQNKNARFAFYYQATDIDNPAAVRYFIRAAKTRDNSGEAPVLNDGDIIAGDLQATSFEIITPDTTKLLIEKNGHFYMSKDGVINEDAGEKHAEGRIFWDVWVSDGYDTVYADKIQDNGKSRSRSFFLGDPGATTGTFKGVFKFDGLGDSSYADARISFQDAEGNNFDATIKSNGYFEAKVPPGIYSMAVSDLILGRGYPEYKRDSLFIEVDDTRDLGKIILKDTSKPNIRLTDKDSVLYSRNDTFAGTFVDSGSQVKTASAWLDDAPQTFSFLSYAKWSVVLADLADGEHLFKMVAQDSAGNISDTSAFRFSVRATKISLNINGLSNMTRDSISIQATISNAKPEVTSLSWNLLDTSGTKIATTTTKVSNNKSTLFMDTTTFRKLFGVSVERNVPYNIYATSSQDATSDSVSFGFLGDKPMVIFKAPTNGTTVSINDSIFPVLEAYANNSDGTESYELSWTCEKAVSCPATNELTAPISWKVPGEYKLTASIKNKEGKTTSLSITVHVIADPPTIKVQTDEDTIRTKINTNYNIPINAADKYGTITAISATCSGKSNGAQSFSIPPFSPQKNIQDSIPVKLPAGEDRNYKCVVKATDDDNEIGYDTLFFVVVLDEPHVSLNIKKQTLTILDPVSLNFDAVDSIGFIAKYEFGCHHKKDSIQYVLKDFGGQAPYITMPRDSGMYFCAIRVTDDDELTASDTASYYVLLDPPSVFAQGPYTVTINDQLSLDAIANDGMGAVVKYEWGCGSSKSDDIEFSHFSTNTPQYTATMPSMPENDYICIIRVTDDDGNQAMDTTHIEIVLAPPTVNVANETAVIRQGYNIVLNADAYDYPNFPGEIVKKEWSCGENSNAINSNWQTVSSYDTVWKAPAAVAKLYCIARATDDDGNIAQDTMVCTYSTDLPIISVKEDSLFAVPGDVITLGADTNSVWQGINWYNWQCFDAATKKPLENFSKLDYKSNYNQVVNFNNAHSDKLPYFYATKDIAADGKDMYCVIRAEESSTKVEFADTSYITVISQAQKPIGVISVADTIYLRNSDISLTGKAKYFYSNDWGGYNSINGLIGDDDARDYWWKFGTLEGDNYYQGLPSGLLDTNISEFNEAFIRPMTETEFNICLDFRDSTKETIVQSFLSKHQADEVCRTIYVRKAWKNLSNDTVLEYNNKTPIPPVITTIGTKPLVVYAIGNNSIHSKYYDGSKWVDTQTPSLTNNILELKLENNGSDAYLAILTTDGVLSIYKSTSGTSAWSAYGTTIKGISTADVICRSGAAPVIAYIKSSAPYFSYLNGTSWKETKITGTTTKFSEIKGTFATTSNLLVFVYVSIDNSDNYASNYAIYGSDYSKKVADKIFENNKNIHNAKFATDGSTLYMAFLNQDIENMRTGPYAFKGTVSATEIKWTNGVGFNTNIKPGTTAYSINLAIRNGTLFAAFDNSWLNSAQTQVYYHDGTGWYPYGETDLPYFNKDFYNTHGYYLRGYAPSLSVSSDGKVYLSMLGWENTGGADRNYGPIVMKYVADNWTVKDFKN